MTNTPSPRTLAARALSYDYDHRADRFPMAAGRPFDHAREHAEGMACRYLLARPDHLFTARDLLALARAWAAAAVLLDERDDRHFAVRRAR